MKNRDESALSPGRTPWWFRNLTGYHWFVLTMASLAWMFDCFDQQIFVLFRDEALRSVLPEGTDTKVYGGYATSIFLIGWGVGGLVFGSIGDRIGRARTLTLTVFLYSVFTGLSAFSLSWIDFAIYRFITGIGVGGVFGLAVALTADTLPDRSRPGALGVLQSLSTVGNILAALTAVWLGSLVASGTTLIPESWSPGPDTKWRAAFLIGAIPAFLCVLIQLRLKEPEKWIRARAEGRLTGAKFGSYRSLLGDSRWRQPAIMGMMLSITIVIGLWGLGFFYPDLISSTIEQSMRGKGESPDAISGSITFYKGIAGIVSNISGFLGMLTFTWVAESIGRKRTFALALIGAFLATNLFYNYFNGVSDLWMICLMGYFQFSLFAGLAMYLPELFPTRLRSTGTSFCYNVGRFVAATGPFTLGVLQSNLGAAAIAKVDANDTMAVLGAKLEAFRSAASWISVVFLLGMITLFFLPETKGKELPED